jgi:hypothetical protein
MMEYTIYVTAADGSGAKITGDMAAVEAVTAVLDAAGVRYDEQVETYDFGFYKPAAIRDNERRIADRIDGYDRDDLGESPDY